MGPFPQTVAINGAPAPTVKGLIVVSHGTASTETGFATLAQALADPQGFDRAAFLDRMAQESVAFFDRNLR